MKEFRFPVHELPEEEQREYLVTLGDALLEAFGPPDIPRRRGLDELVLTVLSQNTNDRNRDRGFRALKERWPEWEQVAEAPVEEIEEVVRPAGLAPQKAPRLREIVRRVLAKGSPDMEFIREMDDAEAERFLLELPGVGVKTAYCTLVFSFDRGVFPMDTHIIRVFKRLSVIPSKPNVLAEHRRISSLVPPERCKDIHLNVIRLGRRLCRPRRPECAECPAGPLCAHRAAGEEKG